MGRWLALSPLPLGQSSTHHVLDRVGVERDHANGSCPLVVFLMDFLIECWVVKEPGKELIVKTCQSPFLSSPPDHEKPKVGTGLHLRSEVKNTSAFRQTCHRVLSPSLRLHNVGRVTLPLSTSFV